MNDKFANKQHAPSDKESEIMESLCRMIAEYIRQNSEDGTPVLQFKQPAELTEIIDLQVRKQGMSNDAFYQLMQQYLAYSVRTGHKQFFNQLYAGFNLPAFIGDVLSSLTNTSMYTYEVAPVATLIEKELIKLMNSYTGFTEGEGIFLSGGSNANLIAMFSARNKALPGIRFQGFDSHSRLKAFVSEHAHYSLETAANLLGIGADNVVKIKADANGKMIPSMLEKAIYKALSRHERPFFVAATCGTTLLGAYDPIEEIADICDQYDVWLHADGSFGGSVILSDTYRHLLKGIERTDSFGWTAHKLMNIPLICSVILLRKKGTLRYNLTDINTDYLFHDLNDIEDLGKKSVQCGRHVDAVKLWFAWKYYGRDGYGKRMENLLSQAAYCENKIINHPRLQLLAPRQSFTVCFRYLPTQNGDVNEFNLLLRERLRKQGQTMLNFGYLGETVALRIALINGELTPADIDLLFQRLTDAAASLERQSNKRSCKTKKSIPGLH